MLTRKFAGAGVELPIIGQGTWMMGEKPAHSQAELRALCVGIDLGLTHIDTSEMYGGGKAEELVSRAIEGQRDRVFLVSKVLPSNASFRGTIRACEQSLKRLRTDHLDLYLLHWWSDRHPIEETMRALEKLAEEGKTRFIGVSNLDVDQLELACGASPNVAVSCDQVCYHLRARGIEFDLIPRCAAAGISVVAYSPYGSGDFPREGGSEWKVLEAIARRRNRTPRQVALNFLTRFPGVFAIPKSSSEAHVRENAGAVGWALEAEDLADLDRAFPPPASSVPLAMI